VDDIEAQVRSAVPQRFEVTITSHLSERGNRSFEAVIRNEFLGEQRTIRGREYVDVEMKARAQLTKWREREIRERTATARGAFADRASQTAENELTAVSGLLQATLAVDDRLDWSAMRDTRSFPPFLASPQPSPPAPAARSFWEWLIPALKRKRIAEDERLKAEWEHRAAEHAAGVVEAKARYEQERAAFEAERTARNQSVEEFRARFEAGEAVAVVDYMTAVFERSSYPECFEVTHEVAFDPASKTVVVDVRIPPQQSVPDVIGYKERKTADPTPIRMKKKEHDELYDSATKQTILRTLHEVFEADYTKNVVAAVANGWVTDVDPATGHERTTCVISVSAPREQFEKLNLARVDPTQAIKSLKGLVAGPLSQLGPVKPIMHLDRKDNRFVESRDVLAGYDGSTNLAEIPWEEFEQLVRELFGKIFSGEDAECRVTQASRDGGVDAIAFDPDPIRGGKFVIQAKRYTKVVPVSAVRDLYGTMINEGAAKGILVTTAYFGPDSREFVKDKPITLIDGPRLVYMLEEYGHKVRIDLNQARMKNASSGD
jgi:restriction system protein